MSEENRFKEISKIRRKEEEDEKEEDEKEEIEEENKDVIKRKKKKKVKRKEIEKIEIEELKAKRIERKHKKKIDKKDVKIMEEKENKKEENEIEGEEQEENEIEEKKENENNENLKEKKEKIIEEEEKEKKINENFEKYILEAYQNINNLYNNMKEEMSKSQIHFNLKPTEKILRSALKICEEEEDIKISIKIIDRLSRLSTYNEMNLNYIIGNIYISLMNKDSLFDEKEVNDLLLFVNKVIQFREIMKSTKLGIEYNISLNDFLNTVTEDFDLDDSQLSGIKLILENNKEIIHNIPSKNTFSDFVFSLAQELEMQPNIYEQYKVIIQNKKDIIDLIELSDLDDKKNYNHYLKLGKYLAYLFYNKSFSIYLRKDNNSDNNDVDGIRRLYFDGYNNKGEMDIINDEKYIISDDNIVNKLREKLCEIILVYVEKYIDLIDFFSFQYLIYVLLKRMYFSHYEKYNKQIIPLLAESLLNMCFFKESPLRLIKGFINKILKSEKKEHLELKNELINNLKEIKKDPNFLYKIPKSIKLDINEEEEEKKEEEENEEEEEESDDDSEENEIDKGFTTQKEEVIFILQNDIKLGFFNYKVLNAGEKFVYYEEINKEYSILDFCLNIDELDIKFTITDLTEGREIFSKDRVNCIFDVPLKIVMFFTSPRILKFEFDNSYSWLRTKTIEYKTNIFYPKHPYLLGHQILISKYQKIILQSKIKEKKVKKSFVDEGGKILIAKINGEKKVFNFVNVNQNLNAIDKMVKDKYLSVGSIYIKIRNEKDENSKSYFYYYKENEGLIENELIKENVEKYLYDILSKSNENLYAFNLYIINGGSKDHYYYYSIKKLLGFEPVIKIEGVMQKIIFFIQNLNQSQLLYYLYKQIYNNESIDIIILINYSKYSGYQIALYNNEEITSNANELFADLNKNIGSIDENMKIISKGIEKLIENDNNIDVILTASFDDKENEITPDKIEEKLGINKNRNNIRIIKTNVDFNKEAELYSHVFYLDN